MWRTWSRDAPYPMPWWLQQTFRRWIDNFDGGMFDSKEAALASNALYRYWNMVGVKDAHQESLVGQAGEIEPVYERYAVTFFIVADGKLHLPQWPRRLPGTCAATAAPGRLPAGRHHDLPAPARDHRRAADAEHGGRRAESRRGAQPAGRAARPGPGRSRGQLGVAVSRSSRAASSGTTGPARYLADFTAVLPAVPATERRLETNTGSGPVFDVRPATFGLYGNPNASGPGPVPVRQPVRGPRCGRRRSTGRRRRPTAVRHVHGRLPVAVRRVRRRSSHSTSGCRSTTSAVPATSRT